MKKIFRQFKRPQILIVFLIFVISVCVRVYISRHTSSTFIFGDEILYTNLIRSWFYDLQNLVRNQPAPFINILYPLLMVPVNLFTDSHNIHGLIQILNCIYMSSVVFPIYLLANKILKNKKYVIAATIFSVLVPEMSYTLFAMSEAVHYPLVAWLFYCVYIDFEKMKQRKTNYILPLMFFLLYFNKMAGVAFIAVYGLFYAAYFLYTKNKDRVFIIKKLVYNFAIFALLYFLSKYLIIHMTDTSLIGRSVYSTQFKEAHLSLQYILKFIYGMNIYFMFYIITLSVFPFMIPLLNMKKNTEDCVFRNYNIFVYSSILITLAIVVLTIFLPEDNASSSIIRIHYRYLFMFAPILFINMCKVFEDGVRGIKINKNVFYVVCICFISLILSYGMKAPDQVFCDNPSFSFIYTMFSREPAVSSAIIFVLILTILSLAWYFFKDKISWKKLSVILFSIVFCMQLLNNILYFRVVLPIKDYAPYREAAEYVNTHLDKGKKALQIPIDNPDFVTGGYLEMYLKQSPYTIYCIDLIDLSTNNLNGVTLPGRGYAFKGRQLENVEYIIAHSNNIYFVNENVQAQMGEMKIIKVDDDNINIDYINTMVHHDNWIKYGEGEIDLFKQGDAKSESIKIEFENVLFIDGIDITVNVAGSEHQVSLPYGKTIVNFDYNWENNNHVDITVKSIKYIVPEGDDRKLSVKINSVEHAGK